jgi:hypothetical protein
MLSSGIQQCLIIPALLSVRDKQASRGRMKSEEVMDIFFYHPPVISMSFQTLTLLFSRRAHK